VQVFYTWRIYSVSKKAWLVGPVFLAELFRLGMCVTITALAWHEGNLPAFRAHYDYIVYITLVSSAAVSDNSSFHQSHVLTPRKIDLWNTSVLCFYLRSRRSNISKYVASFRPLSYRSSGRTTGRWISSTASCCGPSVRAHGSVFYYL
jgi:hypothetical protein